MYRINLLVAFVLVAHCLLFSFIKVSGYKGRPNFLKSILLGCPSQLHMVRLVLTNEVLTYNSITFTFIVVEISLLKFRLSLKMTAFWDIVLCSLEVDRGSGRTYGLHYQGEERLF
jgi:hypothetical protein